MSENTALAVKVLFNEKNFKSASQIDGLVPNKPGLYCIRIKETISLPAPFANELAVREHNIIYIGIATQSLQTRMLGQELRARGHGTFFRSIGAVLGYRPQRGSLVGKSNQNNYTFSKSDASEIILWINENLLINWVAMEGNLNVIETNLLKQHLPLLNIAGNPGAMDELRKIREECKRIARE